jgi:hypothetical protein
MVPDPLVIKNMLEQTVKDMRAAGYEDFTPVWCARCASSLPLKADVCMLRTGPEQGLGELEDRLKEKHWCAVKSIFVLDSD